MTTSTSLRFSGRVVVGVGAWLGFASEWGGFSGALFGQGAFAFSA